ncbi:hypothetical protein GUJ93_ZPchr0001g31540 [Zizania palustris]|uniref:RING-CH-type domain-containing protein n=1 Tax=Zizania palustris TaxID=103762 RepID=A0A8J5RVG6_ZIZPA|nr:hypothetical protein GUJ93_ZPchr0001g31540 [Zizania palustris]
MERDELCCSVSLRQCRICHDEEEEGEEGCTAMESPCGCSGSLKYAHRGCVQRWCDEKGSTLCEICLQNFEPGYTAPPKKAQPAHVAVTIRESLEVPTPDYEPDEDAALIGDQEYAECAGAAGRSASWCRSVAVTFTVMLLLRHLVAVVTVGAAHQYAFSLLTIYLLRASGILLPFYVVMRLISTVQKGQRQYQLQLLQEQRRNALRMQRLHGQEQQHHHAVIVG